MQKYLTLYHSLTFLRNFCNSGKLSVFKQQAKLNKIKRCSKQNTYHVVNKNIAPSKVTDERR